ncbi:hypothetical protein BDB00DRAFT_637091 [Zychaea mexicana]|uniref:uncharacterized protein n=1 Tax=Zychaea mexicana TaxID=64656 RepID=UPI0022FF025D|nr:uncharacterized protein BDB00DRAFT_637091 [Zychaea mexicana]KAI9489181.1 hypothetical protein BDB00DRAFT_637091 [Zychaea mexicana]
MKKLYQYTGGDSFIVRPLEFLRLPSGLNVSIYASEPHQHSVTSSESPEDGDDSTSNIRAWIGLNRQNNTRSHATTASSYAATNATYYDLERFLKFGIKCLEPLDFIHRYRCIHGEIRMEAFQWDGSDKGSVKLCNFGSGSKSLESYLTLSADGWRKTMNNKELVKVLRGVLIYMSPEQTGRTTYPPDHRTDIYSLGVMFFVLLTGRRPFEGSPLETLKGILSRKLPPVHELQRDVPEVISRIIEKMTNKAPDDRYTSARGVSSDLKECLKRLKAAKHPSTQWIEPFPLAQKDIASVFTLPKSIYGRQSVIAEVTAIIGRCALLHRPFRLRNGTEFRVDPQSLVELSSETESSSAADSGPKSALIFTAGQRPTTVNGATDNSSIGSRIFTNSSKTGTVVVGLYGPGGIGKSTIYTAVQPAARQNGYVASTKFDARNKTPYSAVTQALSQIFQQVLSENEDEISAFYTHLKCSLGAQFCNIHVMVGFVPELKPLLQEPDIEGEGINVPEMVRLDNIETQARFRKVYVEVFRAITSWRTATLFLDDLHQADSPSLELIEALAMARVRILIFISYRDQEMTPELSTLLKHLADIHLIKIEPLDKNSIADFICEALHRSSETDRAAIMPLANVVVRKTQCNAFYAVQLLRTLERKKLIFFNWEKNEWDYNLRDIEDVTVFDDGENSQLNVSFMVKRLRELPHAAQDLLKWASFIGDTFSWETVKALMISAEKGAVKKSGAECPSVTQYRQQQPKDDACSSSSSSSSSTLTNDSSINNTSNNSSGNTGLFKRLQRFYTRSPPTPCSRSPTGSDYDPISGLQAVLQEGYIVPINESEFKWSHDRISQAAAALADPNTLDNIHLTVAQHLMEEKLVDTFLVADHLLKCIDLLMLQDDKERYRQIFVDSATKCQTAGAHDMAFAYFNSAIQLSDPNQEWNDINYSGTLLLYTNAVALSWVVGAYTLTEQWLDIIFAQSRCPLDRVPAYRVQSRYLYSIQKTEQAQDALLRCLDELGREKARLDISEAGILREYSQAERLIRQFGVDGILAMKPCENLTIKATMGVLEELLVSCFFGGQMLELCHWACRILNLTALYGPTNVTGSGCMATGIGFASLYQKYKFAEEVGSLGIALADKYGSNQEKGRAYHIYAAYVLQWKYPLSKAYKYYQNALDFCSSAGDNMYYTFNRIHICILMFGQGYNMQDVARESQATYDEILIYSPTVETKFFSLAILRAAKALQGQTYINTPNVFDGDDGFNDSHFVSESCEHSYRPNIMLNWYESYKIVPLTLYGYLDSAIEIGYRSIDTMYAHPSYRHTRMMLCFFSLALIEKTRQDPTIYQKCIEQVKRNQELVHEWAIHSPNNYSMFWTFVEAELAGISDDSPDISKAGRLYEEAINLARKNSWYFDLCVMHEYTGAFYNRIGLYNTAYGYIRKAVDLYMKHGAYGKGRHVSNKFSQLLSDFDDVRSESQEAEIQTDPLPYHGAQGWSPSASSNGSRVALNEPLACEFMTPATHEQTLLNLDIIDMASILKSSQVLSSEIQFNALLSSMMGIILDVSAADCVAIVIKDDKFGVCAYGTQQDSSTTYDPPKPLSEDDDLVSSRIINHTIHTGESTYVNDVQKDTRFAVGPWFERVKRKSVVCMPIIHKVTTVGCLFIEGVVGIFTQRHIAVLSLLCQQMGISITNAFLFKSVQRATMTNMRMIEKQKQALEEARRSKEAADKAMRLREIFLANMSHEIRTPFSGFYGMISLLADTNLDIEQRDLVQTAKESCEMLLQLIDDLLNFSKLQAGKVSLDLSPIVIDDLLADVIEMLIALAIRKSINISYSVEPDVPAVIMADGNRIRQVIINLLGNALKFTHDGEVKIRCSMDKKNLSTDGKISLLFEVVDSGIGISEEQRKVLFVPFSQVDGSTTRNYGGTGLGLSICLQLVSLMSGKIDVKSEPNKGSNFFFNITTSRVHEQANKREDVIADLLKKLNGARVLVAATHESTASMIRQLLPGIAVDGAHTPGDFIHRQATNYHVVLVGLWLTSDPELQVWTTHLKQFLQSARCVVVMHYPSVANSDVLCTNNLPTTGITDDERLSQNGRSDLSSSTLRVNAGNVSLPPMKLRSVVRISVPLRRINLLQALVDMIQQTSDDAAIIKKTLKTPSTPRPSISTKTIGSRKKASQDTISPEEQALYSTQTLLIAEDNPVAQKLLYKQLTRLGFKVVCANNGLEAVEAWQNNPPGYFSLAMLDYHMPQCDGVEATGRIRKLEKNKGRNDHFPIVALTADIQESTRQTCLAVGMDGYLTKPVSKKLLIDTLRNYCFKSKTSNDNSLDCKTMVVDD